MTSFGSIEGFRSFVLSTKSGLIRSIYFTTDFLTIRLLSAVPRASSTAADVETIAKIVTRQGGPCWFAVRTDLDDPRDSCWCIGYFSPEEGANSLGPPVFEFARILFPETCFQVWFQTYHSRPSLEMEMWHHLFPSQNLLTNFSKPACFIVTVEESLVSPKFRVLPDDGPLALSRFCMAEKPCFIAEQGSVLSVRMLNPDGKPCAHCKRPGIVEAPNPIPRTVYAFMKADLPAFLGPQVRVLADINNCGEFHASNGSSRRRSHADVLSPPTKAAYNKGTSKRTRNLPFISN